MGKVAGTFAHDIGNILMAVQLSLDSLHGHVTAEAEDALHSAKIELEHGVEAVRSLLTFARRGSLEKEFTDAKALLENVSGLLRQAIGTHSTLELSIEEGLWPIEINVNQLQLALLNLAVNARDAMPDGGKLRVAARNASLAGAPDNLTGDFIEISASDTGSGMPPELAHKVFEPFFTTKDAGKGTGLGLSQVYGFAKGCGGTVTLTSAVGQGTTVTIYIPRTKVISPLPRPDQAMPERPATTKKLRSAAVEPQFFSDRTVGQ
jgi:two-component system, NtrC family, sensor kinase